MEEKKFFTTKSGLARAYFLPSDWQIPIPSIEKIMSRPFDYIDLINHLALNHKGLNWRIYHQQLHLYNYQVFIFSLAFSAIDLNPTSAYSWQICKNARRIKNYLNKNFIRLSPAELEILNICINFTTWNATKSERIKVLSSLIDELRMIYIHDN